MPTLSTKFLSALAALLLIATIALLPGLREARAGKPAQRTVVYHLDDGARAVRALRNIGNHRRADADIRIIVVALAGGVEFLVDGKLDEHGNAYDAMVDPLMMDGVEFRVCNNTLNGMRITKDKLLPDVQVVPAGVAEIARLQIDEGAAYIKP